jgi:hypothetical protein
MADYQIICTRKTPSTPSGHHHIVQVGLGSGSSYTQLLTVADVYGLMRNGDRFYTVSPSTRRVALVDAWRCCGIDTLRSRADAVADNNLDNLGNCG